MALFNKLFFSSSNKRKPLNSHQSRCYMSQLPFDTSQVRVLLYRECDNRGRRLLFDSSAIHEVSAEAGELRNSTEPTPNSPCTKSDHEHLPKSSKTWVKITDNYSYKHDRSTADVAGIGEMIFGALAMSFRGTSLKVHWLQSPARILFSQVFLCPVQPINPGNRKHSTDNSAQSMYEQYSTENSSFNSFSLPFSMCVNRHLNHLLDKSLTIPLNVPDSDINGDILHRFPVPSAGDSGYAGTDLWTASVSSCYQYSTRSSLCSVFDDQDKLRKLSVDSSAHEISYPKSNMSSEGNMQRRISRNISTSFENRISSGDFIGFIGDNYQTVTNGGSDGCVTQIQKSCNQKENRSNPEMVRQRRLSSETTFDGSGHSRSLMKRAKLGLAICITMTEQCENEMEQFCCEHIALLESMLCRLRASAENAYINHRNFLQIMLNAWQTAARWIMDLFTAPRLPYPIWITIDGCEKTKAKTLADSFMKELCWLLSSADTKDTNFFVSKTLTAVLTNHLGWAAIVSVLRSRPKIEFVDGASNQRLELLDNVSRFYPYNALWAQIGDLYGAIGNPPKISRTILHGTEKSLLERLLNVLAYFIRCGLIRRVNKTENFDKINLDEIIMKQQKEEAKSSIVETKPKPLGLVRSRTCLKSLDVISCSDEPSFSRNQINCDPSKSSILLASVSNSKKHDEDTYNENKPIHNLKSVSKSCHSCEPIHLTVTSPENIEVPVASLTWESFEDNEAIEAIEIELTKGKHKRKSFSLKDLKWNMNPIQDGLSLEDVERLQRGVKVINERIKEAKPIERMSDISNTSGNEIFNKTILEGISETLVERSGFCSNTKQAASLTWGAEASKIDHSGEAKLSEINKEIKKHLNDNSNQVVFVLGDNEALVNIKKSNEHLTETNKNQPQVTVQRTCKHHKKHSGVKFNFEQYPQIATNYMKSKNLDLLNYDFIQKSMKFEELFKSEPSTSSFLVDLPKDTQNSYEECEFCAGGTTLQTPSNATELEFETDNYSAFSPIITSPVENLPLSVDQRASSTPKKSLKFDVNEHVESIESIDIKKEKGLEILRIPVPGIEERIVVEKELKSGFVPSLMIGITDHYISDMVLQGVCSSPETWEATLKYDLALASRCASFTSTQTENLAIVADLDKWDVKVFSSQAQMFPYTNGTCGPVGMSQLVSTMLETVQVMSNSGLSSFECLSYIESKLDEMYMQSEVLAAFLLATEFCSLNTVTSVLNVSENDVPLLFAVASVHSPQLTKKYGVSFR